MPPKTSCTESIVSVEHVQSRGIARPTLTAFRLINAGALIPPEDVPCGASYPKIISSWRCKGPYMLSMKFDVLCCVGVTDTNEKDT